MSNFVHLHCHSEYSLLDGAIGIHDLVLRAKELEMPAVAVTDHGVMYGCASFYQYCLNDKIKPIIGCEVYVAPDHKDKTSEFSRVRHHLILLAQNLEGYKNLSKLVTAGCVDGYHYKPRVDKNLLRRYSNGLIALSACIAGEIPRTLIGENRMIEGGGTFNDARRILNEYREIYPDRFYLEVQANDLPRQAEVNQKLIELAKSENMPLVATNDCHYLNADDAEAHDVLLCIQTQHKVTEKNRFRFEARDLYYKTADEMSAAFADLPEAIENTLRIADMCNVELDLKHYYFPKYPLPDGVSMNEEFVRLAREGLEKRLNNYPNKETINPQVYRDRLEHELRVIQDMKFPDYFLIVQDFINWAKDHNIPVGPGRGSAAGSVVAWALRITNIDPLPYNLLFERFLNSERVSLPDIDVDFCEDRRSEVIQYMIRRYGKDNVAQIAAFGKMKAKAVVKDVGRAMDFSFADTNRIAKLIPANDLKMTLRKALDTVPELAELYQNDSQIKKLIDISLRLEGLSRHASTHAAGLVVSREPLVEYLPLFKNKASSKDDAEDTDKNDLVTQYDKKMVEKVGLVKFDFLGLRTMTLIHNAIDAIIAQGKTPPDLETLPPTDAETYEMFSRGETEAVFQLESSGMRKYLRMLKPSCFEDIIAMLALYRPGPLKSGMVDEFIKRKHGEVAVEYPLPSLEHCLKDTYGVIVYQEQVMQIAQIVGGYTLGGADLLRRAMGKKDAAAMAEQRSQFVNGAIANQVDPKIAGEIFDLMEKFAEYGFNKSHSAAYALVTYHTAYLKRHFPVEYMSAVLTSEIGTQEHILKYIALCRDMNIEVKQPDINISRRNFTAHDDAIIYGFGGIKNVGDEAISSIIEARQKGGPFTSLYDLCTRVNLRKVTKRMFESLIKSGACDCFGVSRKAMLTALDTAVARAQHKAKIEQSNQISLLSLAPVAKTTPLSGIGFECPESSMPEWPDEERLRFEKESLGFFLTSHPLLPFRQELYRIGLKQLEDVRDLPDKSGVKTGVIITGIKEILTKRGDRMAFVSVEDLSATAEVTFFSDDYRSCRDVLQQALQTDLPLLLTAFVDNHDTRDNASADANDYIDDEDEAPQEIKLRGQNVVSLADACQSDDAPVNLEIDADRLLAPDGISILKAILEQHRGTSETQVTLVTSHARCLMRLGPRWCVNPVPKLYKDIQNWNES